MCSLASQTCRRTGLLNCCHGIGTIRTCRWSLELGIMLYAIRGPRRVLSFLQGRHPVIARHRRVDGQRPKPTKMVRTAARLVDAADCPFAAIDGVVWPVFINTGAETSGAHRERHLGRASAHLA